MKRVSNPYAHGARAVLSAALVLTLVVALASPASAERAPAKSIAAPAQHLEPAQLDVNHDGVVDIRDVTAFSQLVEANYGFVVTPTVTPTITPSPTTTPAATMTPTATPHVHATTPPNETGACGEPTNVWHGNTWGSCFTGHEHGDAPPQWVTAWATANNKPLPFSQTREAHTGYKGAWARHASGAESYLIAHIFSTAMARSHGDHDYQLWLKSSNGQVFYWDGLLCFAEPCEAQPPLRTFDTGERPIILAQNDGPCETWYGRSENAEIDLEWIICGRNSNFAGTQSFGVGTHRTVGWFFYPDRFAGAAREAIERDCVVEFGVCRLQFRIDSREYPNTGVVRPN